MRSSMLVCACTPLYGMYACLHVCVSMCVFVPICSHEVYCGLQKLPFSGDLLIFCFFRTAQFCQRICRTERKREVRVSVSNKANDGD